MPNPNYDKRHSATVVAAGALARFRFVGWDGAHATTAGGVHDPQGISEGDAVLGQAVSLITGYSGPVEVAESIGQGDFVRPASDGTGRAVRGTATDNCGRALSTATAVGDVVAVRFVEPGTGGGLSAVVRPLLLEEAGSEVANTQALQAALDSVALLARGGEVRVSGSGVMNLRPVRVPSYCTLVVDAGVVLRRANGVNAPLIRNKLGGQMNKGSRFNRLTNVVTVQNRYHGLASGQAVWVAGLTDASMNGVLTVDTTPDEHSWTYASVGANGAGGAATNFASIIPIRRSLPGASFSSTNNVVTVNDPGHTLQPGMGVWLGTTGASGAFCGVVEVIAVWPDTWQYVTTASGTGVAAGTIVMSYDTDVVITGGGELDGNRSQNNVLQDVDIMLSVVALGLVNRSRVGVKRVKGSDIRCIQAFNAFDTTVEGVEFGDCLVGLQWEGGARRTVTHQIHGVTGKQVGPAAQTIDDMIAYTGTNLVGGQLYDSTVSPYGLTGFFDNYCGRVYAPQCLNGVKLTAHSTVVIDNFVVEDLSGGCTNLNTTPTANSGVRIVDDMAGLQSMQCGRIYIRRVNWTGGQYAVQWGSSGSCKLLDIDGVAYTPAPGQAIGNVGCPVNVWAGSSGLTTGRVRKLRVRNLNHVSPGAAKPALILGSGDVKANSTIQIDSFELDGFELTPNQNASGACIIKYGNATVLEGRVANGLFYGPAAGTGHAVALRGPDNIGRWTFDHVRTAAGGTALSFLATIVTTDQTVVNADIHLKDCDLSMTSVIYDNNTNWSGAAPNGLTLRITGSRIAVTGNLLNLAAATALTTVLADAASTLPVDKLAGAMAGTLRVSGTCLQFDGAKATAPANGDMFWNTNAGWQAGVGLYARGAGAWTRLAA